MWVFAELTTGQARSLGEECQAQKILQCLAARLTDFFKTRPPP